jgi:FAD/FMN-containing dehydrogenase
LPEKTNYYWPCVGGGHNAGGLGVADGALVIDLSHMKGIHVDPVAKTALVQGGCLLKEVDHATNAIGMAVPQEFSALLVLEV